MRRNILSDSANNERKKVTDYSLCGGFKRIANVDNRGIMRKQKSLVVESPPPPPGLESLHHSQDFIDFESRKSVYKQLLEAMEGNYMTGLYGIKGIGKTTLAKEVGAKLHESIKFDNVIYITMPKSSHISEIQDIIAQKFGLSLEGKNEWERMEIIMKRLMNGKRFLLILDDVVEYITLEEVGIPSRDNNMKCRVLLISCDKRLCKSMGCHRSIQLDKLRKREALILFKKHVGTNDHDDMAKKISEACEGLPSQIVLTACILEGRPLEDWEKTLAYLRKLWPTIRQDDEGGIMALKSYAFFNFSHDNSNIEKAQRLSFLLPIYPIDSEMLTRLGIALDIFKGVGKYCEVRNKVFEIKNILINNHVCIEDDKGNVKVNNLVAEFFIHPIWDYFFDRPPDMVHQIYETHEFKLLVAEKWEIICCSFELFRFKKKELIDFPHSIFDYSKLAMLLISIEAHNSIKISDVFFEKISRLLVLHLYSNNLHRKVALKLPSSHWSLENIRSHWKG